MNLDNILVQISHLPTVEELSKINDLIKGELLTSEV